MKKFLFLLLPLACMLAGKTRFPRSITSGLQPAIARAKAANIPPGPKPDNPTELLSSERFRELMEILRKVFDVEHADLKAPLAELGGRSLGETLLTPTKIYVKPVLALLKEVPVKGISHITGGGFYENIPRSIPQGLGARIDRSAVRVLPIFDLIQQRGNISERDMFNTFNMGVGMSLVVAPEDADRALAILRDNGEDAYRIGVIEKSEERIVIC